MYLLILYYCLKRYLFTTENLCNFFKKIRSSLCKNLRIKAPFVWSFVKPLPCSISFWSFFQYPLYITNQTRLSHNHLRHNDVGYPKLSSEQRGSYRNIFRSVCTSIHLSFTMSLLFSCAQSLVTITTNGSCALQNN